MSFEEFLKKTMRNTLPKEDIGLVVKKKCGSMKERI